MMKKLPIYMLVGLLANYSFGQTDFKLVAGDLVPEEQGFYRAGVTYDFNNDGIDDFINRCPTDVDFEDYERRDPANVTYELHNETGTQFGYSYKNCMILPTCDQKYASTLEPALSHGYIQMRPQIDTSDVDLAQSYILSPEVRNIQSITMETSNDVHIQADKRLIPYIIEYSVDGGNTFDYDYYLLDHVQSDEGYRVTYNTDNADFKHIQEVSQNQNVILRFTTNLDLTSLGADKGQYVKVHMISIVADSAVQSTVLSTVAPSIDVLVNSGKIMASKGNVRVFNLSGQFVGAGPSVGVKNGMYVIITEDQKRHKLYIK